MYFKTKTPFENESFSPDGSGILFVFFFKNKKIQRTAGHER